MHSRALPVTRSLQRCLSVRFAGKRERTLARALENTRPKTLARALARAALDLVFFPSSPLSDPLSSLQPSLLSPTLSPTLSPLSAPHPTAFRVSPPSSFPPRPVSPQKQNGQFFPSPFHKTNKQNKALPLYLYASRSHSRAPAVARASAASHSRSPAPVSAAASATARCRQSSTSRVERTGGRPGAFDGAGRRREEERKERRRCGWAIGGVLTNHPPRTKTNKTKLALSPPTPPTRPDPRCSAVAPPPGLKYHFFSPLADRTKRGARSRPFSPPHSNPRCASHAPPSSP